MPRDSARLSTSSSVKPYSSRSSSSVIAGEEDLEGAGEGSCPRASLDLVRGVLRWIYYASWRRSFSRRWGCSCIQLVLFFEDLRSERQLMEIAADRLSIRWYLGYDLAEPLPEHSSLTHIRQRYGLEVFRRFFEEIVQLCIEAGLVWGKELYFDSTKVQANASMDSLLPRFAVEAHLERLFEDEKTSEAEGSVSGSSAEIGLDALPPWPTIETFGQRTPQKATGYR